MAWPAPDLPVNFGNATVSLNTHPQAHNATNQSLNDNFRPELTRVGNAIDGTRTVYLGDNPVTQDATIKTDGVITRMNAAGTVYGQLAAFAGRVEAANSGLGWTIGTTPVNALQLAFGQGFTRGGYAIIQVGARFAPGTVPDGEGRCIPGWIFNNSGGAPTYQNKAASDGGQVTANVYSYGSVTTVVTIPSGTTNVFAVLGVFDEGKNVYVQDGYVSIAAWRY